MYALLVTALVGVELGTQIHEANELATRPMSITSLLDHLI